MSMEYNDPALGELQQQQMAELEHTSEALLKVRALHDETTIVDYTLEASGRKPVLLKVCISCRTPFPCNTRVVVDAAL